MRDWFFELFVIPGVYGIIFSIFIITTIIFHIYTKNIIEAAFCIFCLVYVIEGNIYITVGNSCIVRDYGLVISFIIVFFGSLVIIDNRWEYNINYYMFTAIPVIIVLAFITRMIYGILIEYRAKNKVVVLPIYCEKVSVDSDTDCSICINKITENGVSLKCNHVFHEQCIKPWVDLNPVCPLCRTNVYD